MPFENCMMSLLCVGEPHGREFGSQPAKLICFGVCRANTWQQVEQGDSSAHHKA